MQDRVCQIEKTSCNARPYIGSKAADQSSAHYRKPLKAEMYPLRRLVLPRMLLVLDNRGAVEGRKRDLAMFNLAIDSKLRGCDLVALKVDDVAPTDGCSVERATVRQRKTGWPVKFELTEQSRQAIEDYFSPSTVPVCGSGCCRAPGDHEHR